MEKLTKKQKEDFGKNIIDKQKTQALIGKLKSIDSKKIKSEEALNALEDIELALGIDSCKETSLIRKYINQRSL